MNSRIDHENHTPISCGGARWCWSIVRSRAWGRSQRRPRTSTLRQPGQSSAKRFIFAPSLCRATRLKPEVGGVVNVDDNDDDDSNDDDDDDDDDASAPPTAPAAAAVEAAVEAETAALASCSPRGAPEGGGGCDGGGGPGTGLWPRLCSCTTTEWGSVRRRPTAVTLKVVPQLAIRSNSPKRYLLDVSVFDLIWLLVCLFVCLFVCLLGTLRVERK